MQNCLHSTNLACDQADQRENTHIHTHTTELTAAETTSVTWT